jgi:hypothetical protein
MIEAPERFVDSVTRWLDRTARAARPSRPA